MGKGDQPKTTIGPEFAGACNNIAPEATTRRKVGNTIENIGIGVGGSGLALGFAGAFSFDPLLMLVGAGTAGVGSVIAYAGASMETMAEKQMDELQKTGLTDCAFTDTYRSIHGSTEAVSVLDAARDPQTFQTVYQEMATTKEQKESLAAFALMENNRLERLKPPSINMPAAAAVPLQAKPSV
jgi:hypothetical protein